MKHTEYDKKTKDLYIINNINTFSSKHILLQAKTGKSGFHHLSTSKLLMYHNRGKKIVS